MNLRERCEKLRTNLSCWMPTEGPYAEPDLDLIEAFVREIRNEALEEAIRTASSYESGDHQCFCRERIRVLKTNPESEPKKDK